MRLASIALICALAAPLATFAAPSDDEISAARLAYIDGNFNAALPVLQEAADAGNARALNILGAAYEDGHGVVKDTRKAIDFFERAAKAGEVRASYNLGSLFTFGSGDVSADLARATREFQTAADQNYPPAITALGQLQELAEPPNHDAAADWYEKGHDAGDVVGTANLAHAYLKGRGRPVNWIKARVLYTEAAARGYPRAFNDLGVMHEDGYGVHMDQLTAFSFFKQGVDRGYPKAGVNLAELIIAARFPFSSKHAALGYCIWALERVEARERAEFESDCAAVRKEIAPDEAMLERARIFANRIN